ncbi:MAG: 1,4-dihydroxy-2-naphthoate octaprenyltransferase [Chloroflexi bacterium]|nr:1,4-dihydroxy-2-naphthoate octaprenyltransferase [Chloroflexota bacterium]
METTISRATWRDTAETIWRFIRLIIPFLAPIFLLVLWEALVRGDFRIGALVLFSFDPPLKESFFARPTDLWPKLRELYDSGTLASVVWASSVRVIYGFVLGAVPAILLGLLMSTIPLVYDLFQPLAEALYAIPKIAFIPLVIFLYGLSEEGLVNIVAFSVFFLVLLSVVKSVKQIDPRYREIARSFGANPLQVFFSVVLPGAMPGIVTSLQLGLGFALVVIVGAEFLSSSDGRGLGYFIWEARNLYLVVDYFAGLVIAGIMGYGFAWLMQRASRMLLPWLSQPSRATPTRLQRRLTIFWRAMRPWSFGATLVPVVLGSAIAGYDRVTRYNAAFTRVSLRPKIALDGYDWTFDWGIFALAFIGAIAFQAGTNLVNDYYDHVKGADNESSLGIGGTIQRGELSPRSVLAYGIIMFVLGSAIGLYLVTVSGPFILYLGIFSVLAGFFYTAGPVALAYIGLGEITVSTFMGPIIVIGAYYVQVQNVNIEPILAALPIAFTVSAILQANNIRDIESDREVGKRTLATIFGKRFANIEYFVLVGGAYVLTLVLVLVGVMPAYTLIAFITLPSALSLMYRVASNPPPPALNPVLRRTAQLHTRFGLLLTTGWFLAMIREAYLVALSG